MVASDDGVAGVVGVDSRAARREPERAPANCMSCFVIGRTRHTDTISMTAQPDERELCRAVFRGDVDVVSGDLQPFHRRGFFVTSRTPSSVISIPRCSSAMSLLGAPK